MSNEPYPVGTKVTGTLTGGRGVVTEIFDLGAVVAFRVEWENGRSIVTNNKEIIVPVED